MRAVSLLAMTALISQASAEECVVPATKLPAGLEANVTLAGISSSSLGLSLQIVNKGSSAVQMLLVGPGPIAVDSFGNRYGLFDVTGVTKCSSLADYWVASCLGLDRKDKQYTVPLEAFTQLEPGTSISVTYSFTGSRNPGDSVSLSSVFAYRVVQDPLKDLTLDENTRRQQLRTMSVSVPRYCLTRQNR